MASISYCWVPIATITAAGPEWSDRFGDEEIAAPAK